MNKEITLDSGAKLNITLASFAEGNALFKAFSKVVGKAEIDGQEDIKNPLALKDLFCSLVYSDELEKCLWACMKRATYNGHKITPDTFEEIEARQDYLEVISEVGQFNLTPFLKSLYARFLPLLETFQTSQE